MANRDGSSALASAHGSAALKQKIVEFLEADQPVSKRRAWWNIAFNLGIKNDERVKAALQELLAEKRIYRVSVGKGHAYGA